VRVPAKIQAVFVIESGGGDQPDVSPSSAPPNSPEVDSLLGKPAAIGVRKMISVTPMLKHLIGQ